MLESYLGRVRYQAPVATTKETLFGLQRAHLDAIPYENLDTLLEKRLSEDAFHAQLVS